MLLTAVFLLFRSKYFQLVHYGTIIKLPPILAATHAIFYIYIYIYIFADQVLNLLKFAKTVNSYKFDSTVLKRETTEKQRKKY
jgi:hypothetical protein